MVMRVGAQELRDLTAPWPRVVSGDRYNLWGEGEVQGCASNALKSAKP